MPGPRMDGDTLATSGRFDERAKVETWRLRVLIDAGYPVALAERVAASEADLHRAVELIHAGCPARLAARILI